MAYKTRTVKQEKLAGKSKVQLKTINGKQMVGITFKDNPDKVYAVPKADAPASITEGYFYIRLSTDKTKILSCTPLNGPYRFKVHSFPAKEGEKPAPFVYNDTRFGYSEERFNVVLEIVAPKHVGMTVVMQLPYKWFSEEIVKVGEEVRHVLALREPQKQSNNWDKLDRFMRATLPEGDIPYSDNVLPALEKRMLRAGKEFDGMLENGFMKAISVEGDDEFGEPSDAPASWADEEEDETTETAVATTSPSTEPTTSWGTPVEAEEFEEQSESDDETSDAPWDKV